MPKRVFKCQDRCPLCDSTDLEWSDTDVVWTSEASVQAKCLKCGTVFTELYELRYMRTVVDKPGNIEKCGKN